jgi:hypothetical protein
MKSKTMQKNNVMPLPQSKVTQLYWKNLPELLNPSAAKSQSLIGFDDEFIDIVDYIIRITHRIWEQKNVGLCRHYYAEYCPVHTLGAYADEVSSIVSGTLQTISTFPDRSLIGENVIWRDLGSEAGYYSSHRITSIMTNKGASEFGEATHKTGRVTTIADCICFENKIVYEWLVRDNGFLVKQLGIDVLTASEHFAKLPTHPKFDAWRQAETARVKTQQASEHQWNTPIDPEALAFSNKWLNTLFNKKNFGEAHLFYHLNAKLQWPGGRQAVGIPSIKGTIIQWLAMCPDALVTCDHVSAVAIEQNSGSVDIAIRWSLAGTFSAAGKRLSLYRGQDFFILGASHLRVVNGKISEEWTVFDEVAAYANLIRDFNQKNTDSEATSPC